MLSISVLLTYLPATELSAIYQNYIVQGEIQPAVENYVVDPNHINNNNVADSINNGICLYACAADNQMH